MMFLHFSACGKTMCNCCCITTLIFNLKQIISVWLYKLWQPLYTETERSVVPTLEFHTGIHTNFDTDDLFDSRTTNLLILDEREEEGDKDDSDDEKKEESAYIE